METSRGLDIADSPRPVLSPLATSFVETLRLEQDRFLEALLCAHAAVRHESGQLAQSAAMHVRLTRQFFDAQRSILVRIAAVDAQIDTIRTGVGTPCDALSSGPTGGAFGHLIDRAFVANEPDAAAAQRELTTLLDGWWCTETERCEALVGDALARVAIESEFAEMELDARLATELVLAQTVRAETELAPATCLPRPMATALDAAEPASLQAVLSSLAESLAPREAGSDSPSDWIDSHPRSSASSDDAGLQFWPVARIGQRGWAG